MKGRLAVTLLFMGMLGFWGVSFGGSLDREVAARFFPARVEKTGQTHSYAPKDDGELQKGVAWPNPRFTDNGDGTVTDNLTGLVWLKNANCGKFWAGDGSVSEFRIWNLALKSANKLRNGYCGLTDGSEAGDWRLPNIKELQSLIHYGFDFPALPNTAGTGQCTNKGDPFSGVNSWNGYWSSTSYAQGTTHAWMFCFGDGSYDPLQCDNFISGCVWPVRGGR